MKPVIRVLSLMLKHGNAVVYFSNYVLPSCLEEQKSSSGLWLVCWWCLGAVGTDIWSLSLRKWIPHWGAFNWLSVYGAPPCGLCWQRALALGSTQYGDFCGSTKKGILNLISCYYNASLALCFPYVSFKLIAYSYFFILFKPSFTLRECSFFLFQYNLEEFSNLHFTAHAVWAGFKWSLLTSIIKTDPPPQTAAGQSV